MTDIKEMTMFSVLMSVYDKEEPEYFDMALKSILVEQTLKPTEFILVCDGPLNNNLNDVICKYKNAFNDILKIYRLKENVGLGRALNYGLKKCRFELVARADSDDICVCDRFEKQVSYFLSHDYIAVLGSDIKEFRTDPNICCSYKSMPNSFNNILKKAKYRNPMNHMTVMFKKIIIDSVGSYVHMPYTEDYYLWVRVLSNGYKIENINEALVYARIGNGMVERRGNKKQVSSLKQIYRYMLKNNMINSIRYIINMITVRVFVYMPSSARKILYSFLRK